MLRLRTHGAVRLSKADRVGRSVDVVCRDRRRVLRPSDLIGVRHRWGRKRGEGLAVRAAEIGVGNPVNLRIFEIEILVLETGVVRAWVAAAEQSARSDARERRSSGRSSDAHRPVLKVLTLPRKLVDPIVLPSIRPFECTAR